MTMVQDFSELMRVAEGQAPPIIGGGHGRQSMPGATFVLDAPDRIDGLWGAHPNVLWAKGEGFMIAGQQGSGKTTIAQQLILEMLGVGRGGGSFLGLPVKQLEDGGSVLYLAMDRPTQARRSFRRMVVDTPANRLALDTGLKTWLGPLPGDVTAAMLRDPYALVNWIKATYCGVEGAAISCVVFDSVKDVLPDLSDGKIGQALNSSWQGLMQEGIDMLALHHDRKSGSGESRTADVDAIYGSTWLTSGLGSIVKVLGDPGAEEIVLHHVKQPGEVVGPIPVLHHHEEGRSVVNEDERPRTVEEVLRDAGRAMTTAELAFALYGDDERKSLAATRRRLRKAVEKTGSVVQVGTGRGGVDHTWQLLGIVSGSSGSAKTGS